MKDFNNTDFLLQNDTAVRLYHDYAENQPIIDFHCHLNPREIAEDKHFDDLGSIWLDGDHYKWRAMRSNGVDERFCTGNATSWEKFQKWAETVPYTMCNPLYHWTHLELRTAFGINEVLNPMSAKRIFDCCTDMLHRPDFGTKGLISKYNVEALCTTDDPADTLEWHNQISESGFGTRVLPAWRPDKSVDIEKKTFSSYISKLSAASNIHIKDYESLLAALKSRHEFFADNGCKLSDHGILTFYDEKYTSSEVNSILKKALKGDALSDIEIRKYKSALLYELAVMDAESGWVQQFHYGPMRDNNSRLFESFGPDAGCDSISDGIVAHSMAGFLDRLDKEDKLTKTIIYNLNPVDNALVASMIGNFQDSKYGPAKMQFGAAWWFSDNIDGMSSQLDVLSSMGLLSRFVGMLTDSRSFLSFARHEYFRRLLCNKIGDQVEKGLLPASELDFIGEHIVKAICYTNAKSYFNF
jgi:glucuronate isomerase